MNRRLFFLLAVMLLIGGATAPVSASLLETMGINTSAPPEGFDPADTVGLTGRGVTVVNPVLELLQTNIDSGTMTQTLYGHNESIGSRDETNLSTGGTEVPVSSDAANFKNENIASVPGNFNGDASKDGQVAYVLIGSDQTVHLFVADALDSSLTTPIKPLTTISQETMITDGAFPLQNYAAIAAGDFDGDGFDEIAVYVPESANPRIEFYDLTHTSEDNAWTDWQNWGGGTEGVNAPIWTYSLTSDTYTPNMVSLCAEDFTKDGVDDVAVIWGSYGNTDEECVPSKFIVLEGIRTASVGTDFVKPIGTPLTPNNEEFYRGSVTSGIVTDINLGDPKVIIGGSVSTEKKNTSRYIGVYYFDYENEVPCFAVEEEIVTDYSTAFDNYQKGLQPYIKTNLVTAHLYGHASPAVIYCDSAYFEVSPGSLSPLRYLYVLETTSYPKYIWKKVKLEYSEAKDGAKVTTKDVDGVFMLYFDYYEYNPIAIDLDGDGNETVSTTVYQTGGSSYRFTGMFSPIDVVEDGTTVGDVDALETMMDPNEYGYKEVCLRVKTLDEDTGETNHAYRWEYAYLRLLFVPGIESDRVYYCPGDSHSIKEHYYKEDMSGTVDGWNRKDWFISTEYDSPDSIYYYFNGDQKSIAETDTSVPYPGYEVDIIDNLIYDLRSYAYAGNSSESGTYTYMATGKDGKKYKFSVSPDTKMQGESPACHRVIMGISGGDTPRITVLGHDKNNNRHFTTANTDTDTVYIMYTGNHYLTYTSPQVLAVIASPPYFQDLSYDPWYMRSATSFTTKFASSSVDDYEYTDSTNGGYITDSLQGGSLVAETSLKYLKQVIREKRSSVSREQTMTYTTAAGQDSVALFSIPTEIYEYYVYEPVYENGEWKYNLSLSQNSREFKPAIGVIPLAEYEDIRRGGHYSGFLPQIDGTVLTHTIGDPATYPDENFLKAHSNALVTNFTYQGEDTWAAVKFGSGSIAQSISTGTEISENRKVLHKVDGSIGIGVAATGTAGTPFAQEVIFSAKVTAGFQMSKVLKADFTSNTNFTGETYAGTVNNMPLDAENAGYYYAWKLVTYKHKVIANETTMEIPIVNYLVTDVAAPPSLPTDFQHDGKNSTPTSNVLTWSYSGDASGFNIYRDYDFPEGGGTLLHAYVDASAYSAQETIEGKTTYSYRYEDTNLGSYQNYTYRIQVLRPSLLPKSILSKPVTARTKALEGYPELVISTVNDYYNNAVIYPDSTKVAYVQIQNPQAYPQGFWYQWQKKTDNSTWTDIQNANEAELTAQYSGVERGGDFRVRVNTLYHDEDTKEYALTAYSDTITLTPGLRPCECTQLTAEKEENGTVTIRADFSSTHPDYSGSPGGQLTITIMSDAATIPIQVTFSDGSTWINLGPGYFAEDKVYTITASYNGDAYFGGTVSEDVKFIYGTGGYLLNLPNAMTYGNTSALNVSYIVGNEKGGIESETLVSDPVTYAVHDVNNTDVTDTFISGTEFRAFGAGTVCVTATGTDWNVSKNVTIAKRPVTITAESYNTSITDAAQPTAERLNLSEGTPAAWHTGLSDLQVIIVTKNSAGKSVTDLDTNKLAGRYTITGAVTKDTPENYEITFVPGIYIVRGETYTVSLEAEKVQGYDAGTVTLVSPTGDSFEPSAEIWVQASPFAGYVVDTWYLDGVEQTQYAGHETFLFSMPDKNVVVRVVFTVADSRFIYTVSDTNAGTLVSNDGLPSGNKVLPGVDLSFTAKPHDSWHFVEWRYLENSMTKILNGTFDAGKNEYYVTVTTGNSTVELTAVFARNPYNITLSRHLTANYTAAGGKNIIVKSGDRIPGGSVVTVQPETGYFAVADGEWVEINKTSAEPKKTPVAQAGQVYLFTIAADTTISVPVSLGTYAITGVTVNKAGEENNTVAILVGGVKLEETSLVGIDGGTPVNITGYPQWGYVVESIAVNSDTVSGDTYEVKGIDEDIAIAVTFAKNIPHAITVGSFSNAVAEYKINSGKTTPLSPAGQTIAVYEGDNLAITVTPNPGFMVYGHAKVWNLENIAADQSIQFDIRPFAYGSVTFDVSGNGGSLTATANGKIINSGDDDIGLGSPVVFTAAPETGKEILKWTLNGHDVLNEAGGLFLENTYALDILTVETVVQVSFTAEKQHRVSLGTPANASVSIVSCHPAVTGDLTTIRDAGTIELIVVPDSRYRVAEVTGFGTNTVEETTDANGNRTITIRNVTDDIALSVTAEPDVFDVVPPVAFNASITSLYSPELFSAGKVLNGTRAVFTVVPDAGYSVFSMVNEGGDPLILNKSADGTWICTIESVKNHINITGVAVKINKTATNMDHLSTLPRKTTVPKADLDAMPIDEFNRIQPSLKAPLMPEKNGKTIYLDTASIRLYNSIGEMVKEIPAVDVEPGGGLSLSALDLNSDEYAQIKVTYSGRLDGDINGDGVVNAVDILTHIFDPDNVNGNPRSQYYGDANKDGVVDENDYSEIAMLAVGTET